MLPTVTAAILFCVVVYLLIGVLVASVFGNDTLPVASLNWRNFTGGQTVAPEWANTFSTMLILFPTVDILSAFPLVAFCLGENLAQAAPALQNRYGAALSTYWRLLAAVPPIFGAIGAWLMMVAFPAACVLRSQHLCEERFGKEQTKRNPYKTRCSELWVIYAVCGVSGVMYSYHIGSFLSH